MEMLVFFFYQIINFEPKSDRAEEANYKKRNANNNIREFNVQNAIVTVNVDMNAIPSYLFFIPFLLSKLRLSLLTWQPLSISLISLSSSCTRVIVTTYIVDVINEYNIFSS